jgi:hypothetical protein
MAARERTSRVGAAPLLRELRDLDEEVFPERAADATVLHLDELLVHTRERRVAGDREAPVDVDRAHVVDDDGDPEAIWVGQDVVEHRRLAGAQEAGQDGDGESRVDAHRGAQTCNSCARRASAKMQSCCKKFGADRSDFVQALSIVLLGVGLGCATRSTPTTCLTEAGAASTRAWLPNSRVDGQRRSVGESR